MLRRPRIGALVLVGILSCSQLAGTEPTAPKTPKVWSSTGEGPRIHVVLIALDGTRFQEIFHGVDQRLAKIAGISDRSTAEELLPNLTALARRGVALGDEGSPFVASGPNYVSLPGYAEMLSGHAASCQENDCEARPDHTLVDTFREAGATQREVAVITSWDRIERVASQGERAAMVSTGRTGGDTRAFFEDDPALKPLLDAGADASAEPGHDDYRPDRYTAALATRYFERARPRFLFVALGDTDEHAHRGDYGAYLEALRAGDQMVGDIAQIAAEWERSGDHVMIIATTDHGREAGLREHGRDYPESARTWLIAAGGAFGRTETTLLKAHRLADIAPTIELSIGATGSGVSEAGATTALLLTRIGP